eukprot:6747139-Prymnesium_polylepis.1
MTSWRGRCRAVVGPPRWCRAVPHDLVHVKPRGVCPAVEELVVRAERRRPVRQGAPTSEEERGSSVTGAAGVTG